jgi:hypothetical protein
MAEPPRVLLVDNPAPGAFAVTDARQDKVFPWVFFVQTGMLSAPEVANIPGVLESTIAHELGHLILKNVFAREAYVFYRLGGEDKDQLGFTQKNDPALSTKYATYQAAAARMGRFFDPALGNFPFHVGSSPGPTYETYLKLIVQALAASGTPPPAECALVDDAAAKLQAIVDRRLDKSDVTLPLADDSVAAGVLSASWEDSTRKCLTSVRGPLGSLIAAGRDELTREGTGQADIDAMVPMLDPVDHDLDSTSTNASTIDHWFTIAAARRHAMGAIVQGTDPPYASLRFYTDENEADDAAARIVTFTGEKLDLILNPYSPTYRTECQELLASGGKPEYGGLVDIHHGLCWRYSHIMTFGAMLRDKCLPR